MTAKRVIDQHSELSGIGTDDHHPMDHAGTHETGGTDEISIEDLLGQPVGPCDNKYIHPTTGTCPQDPKAHSGTHETGGTDEISLEDLLGQPVGPCDNKYVHPTTGTCPQDPKAHKTSHQNGGTDEISIEDLLGQPVGPCDNKYVHPTTGTCPQDPKAHKTSHQNGGTDEISVAGLSGELADNQPPKAHESSHVNGGSDDIDSPLSTKSLPQLIHSVTGTTNDLVDSTSWTDMEGMVITLTPNTTKLFCLLTASVRNTASLGADPCFMAIFVDDVLKVAATSHIGGSDEQTFALSYLATVSSGASHTVKGKWHTAVGDEFRIDPSETLHDTLTVMEVT